MNKTASNPWSKRPTELEAEGERDLPGLSAADRRERAAEAYEAVAPKEPATIYGLDGEETARSKGTSASERLYEMRADGGESA